MIEPLEVPWQSLSDDALRGVIEEFITREGTDYGEVEISLERKVAQILHQLKRNEAAIVFDEQTESCTIISKRR